MKFDKKAFEKELIELIDGSSDRNDLRHKLIVFWDSRIKQVYGEEIGLFWFLDTLDSNNEKARRFLDIEENDENKKLRQNWVEQSKGMFNNIANGADLDFLFDSILKGGSFDLYNKRGDTALIYTMEDGDIVTASLIMLMGRTVATVTFPSDGELFKQNNAMLTAFKSDPRFLKMLIAINPKNCYNLDNEHAVMHEINLITITPNIEKNLKIYREFVESYEPEEEEEE